MARQRKLQVTLILAWLFLALCGAMEARANKLVGVVFDDSGSMRDSYNLPLLGLQMLSSTLDGRQDRLFVARFGWHVGRVVDPRRGPSVGQNVHEVPLTPQDELQRTIDDFRDWRINEGTNTPFAPLTNMLDALVDQAKPGQEVHFIVVSDGEFNPSGLLTPPQLRARFTALRDRLTQKGARLQAHFLLILNNSDRRTVAFAVEQQGVRAELLSIFNGSQTDGSYVVDSFERLRDAMIEIIARVSDTDARRSSSVVERSGQHITMRLPFAVSRVIALSTGQAGALMSRPGDLDVGTRPMINVTRLDTVGGMRVPDTLAAWQSLGQWTFATTQFTPASPLPPGTYLIPFDGPTGNVTMLFRTDVSVGWRLLEQDKELPQRTPDNPAEVEANRELTLDIFVNDRLAGNRIVNLADLPHDAEFIGRLLTPSGATETIPLRLLKSAPARVQGPVTFKELGANRIEVEMRVAGAPSVSSGLIAVNIVPRMDFFVEVNPSIAKGDNRFAVETTAGRTTDDPSIATITLRAVSQGNRSEINIAVRDLPPGVEAIHGDAPLPSEGKTLALEGPTQVDVILRRTAQWTGIQERAPISANIIFEARALKQARGELQATIELSTKVPPAELRKLGHSADPSGETPLTLGISELGRPGTSWTVNLTGTLETPTAENFKVVMPGWLSADVDLGTPRPDGTQSIDITPNQGMCFACSLFLFGQKPHDMELTYRSSDGLQTASIRLPFVLTDQGGGGLGACVFLAILILAFLYAMIALLFWLGAYRFPRRAVAAIEMRGDFEPRGTALNRSNWIGTLLRALLWPARLVRRSGDRRIREERRLEGLRVIANPGGVTLLPAERVWPPFVYDLMGVRLDELSPPVDGQETRPVTLAWGGHLVDYDMRRIVGFWERRSDMQSQMPRFFKK
jgi:hypothetical protein